jgi:isopentenyl-diphosphate Delta-isomerase
VSRSKRKIDHIDHALSTGQKRTHGLEDVSFIHNSIPNTAVNKVNVSTKIGELSLCSPIFINAMTGGGGLETFEINRQFAEVAKTCSLAIAVGSQMAAIKDTAERKSYEIVRKINPNGVVFANLGSEATLDQAKLAVDMLEANALQIHLNVIQELVMPEGDRDFSDVLKRLETLVKHLPVPIVVKEVGFGMSKETVKKLTDIGIQVVDIGGYGGTNFASIENKRRDEKMLFFENWGIPTAPSIVEANSISKNVQVIASGGLQTSLDVAKAIALGANACGFAGYFLKVLKEDGIAGLITKIKNLEEGLVTIMTALGCETIESLQQQPLVIRGETYHWLEQRALDITKYNKK